MPKLLCLALLLLTSQVATFVSAQTPVKAESLLIGPGDLLHIQVFDTPQLDQHPRVDDSGNVPLLFLGNVKLVGDTPAVAAASISSKLVEGGLMRHPQVTVSIEQYATQEVSILGQVSKPGSYPITTPRSIFSLLSMAGGLTPMADRTVLVRHASSPLVEQSFFVPNAPSLDVATDVRIFPGDTIIVPRTSFIYVLGDVARPGGYPLTTADRPSTVLEVLAMAGSANKSAALGSTRLLRKTAAGYRVVPVDLASLQVGKTMDIALEADDVLFIPFSYAKNFVLNAAAVATSVASAAIFLP